MAAASGHCNCHERLSAERAQEARTAAEELEDKFYAALMLS